MMDITDNNSVTLLEFLRKRVARGHRVAPRHQIVVDATGEFWDEINSAQPPAFVPVVGVQKPYRRILGSHPEVVEHVWNTLGSVLPQDCRCVVYGAPGLARPENGVIFVLALGTYYALRLPQSWDRDDFPANVARRDSLRPDIDLDAKRDLGEDWILGSWAERELGLCLSAYEQFRKIS